MLIAGYLDIVIVRKRFQSSPYKLVPGSRKRKKIEMTEKIGNLSEKKNFFNYGVKTITIFDF